MAQDFSHFKYEAKDNRAIKLIAISRVFSKTGSFIFNLGLVNFFEVLVVNLIVGIFTFQQEDGEQDADFIQQYQYTLFLFAYNVG
jgi:hypothetical protein